MAFDWGEGAQEVAEPTTSPEASFDWGAGVQEVTTPPVPSVDPASVPEREDTNYLQELFARVRSTARATGAAVLGSKLPPALAKPAQAAQAATIGVNPTIGQVSETKKLALLRERFPGGSLFRTLCYAHRIIQIIIFALLRWSSSLPFVKTIVKRLHYQGNFVRFW